MLCVCWIVQVNNNNNNNNFVLSLLQVSVQQLLQQFSLFVVAASVVMFL
jgi:hypothetical protein